jgi:hypothetical protein
MQLNLTKLKPILLPLLIVAALAVFILVVLFSIFINYSAHQNPSSLKNPVKGVMPQDGATLTSGTKQHFYIYLNGDFADNLIYKLTYIDASSGSGNQISVETNINTLDKGGITLTTLTDIKDYSEYFLTVSDKSTQKVIFSGSYLTTEITPSPVVSNSQGLIPFLPYQSQNYSFEYLKSQKIYIFHFIYNVNSTDSIDSQFEKAKNDALQFIKDKGIDPSGLVIDWRNS